MSKTTFEIVLLVSNVVLAFTEHCFSITYTDPKIALSGVAEIRTVNHFPNCVAG